MIVQKGKLLWGLRSLHFGHNSCHHAGHHRVIMGMTTWVNMVVCSYPTKGYLMVTVLVVFVFLSLNLGVGKRSQK